MTLGGRYRLGEVLGTGGMGQVYAAVDERLDRDVAVKVLRADLARDHESRARFRREARAAARLSHPSIVTVYDTAHDEDEAFLVMERCPGPTLDDELRAGALTPGRLQAVAYDVAAALATAHAAGIVHRDVKPANVLLAGDGRVKVADFGIAKAVDEGETVTLGPGYATPAYTAPERLRGEPATAASDVWSLGVLLYEAATGERPLAGAHRPLHELRPDLDASFVAAVEHMLRPDPAQRPADGAAVVHELVLSPTEALPVVPLRPPKRAVPDVRRRARLALPAALVLAAAIAVALVVAGAGGGTDPARAPEATTSIAPGTTAKTAATVATVVVTTVPPTTVATAPPVVAPGPKPENPGKGKGHDKR